MKYLYAMFLLLTTLTNLTAQDYICGYFEEQAEHPDGLPLWGDPRLLPDYPDTKYVRLAIYDVKGGHLSGVSATGATQVLSLLNQYFRDHKIQFHLVEYDTIDCANCDLGIDDQAFTHKRNNSAVNIYFIDNSNSDWAGKASFPPSNNEGPVTRIIQSRAYTSTVAHEIGHCLGLQHTFGNDYVFDALDENIARADSNGCIANHWYAGDGISDTHADLPGSSIRPCNQVITVPDNCGNYNWDFPKNNIMSYWGCSRNTFTIQQGRAMHYILENWLAHILEIPVRLVEFNVLDSNNNPNFFGVFRTFFINRKLVRQGDEISLIVGKNYNSQMGLYDRTVGNLNHYGWDLDPMQYQLTESFPISENTFNRNSYYKPFNTTIFNTNTVDGVSLSNQSLLNDPWYADANGNQDLGFLPVNGTRNIFLNEGPDPELPNKPIYAIKSDQIKSVDANLKLYFLNWSTTQTELVATTSPDPQAIVFTGSNPTVTAHYKAMLGSNSSTWVNSNQWVNYNGSSTVMYKSNNQLWLHTEDGSVQKETLIESNGATVTGYSVAVNGTDRFISIHYSGNALSINKNDENIQHFSMPFSVVGTVSVNRISDPTLPYPYLLFTAKSGTNLRYFTADIINGSITIPYTPTWNTISLSGFASSSTPVSVSGNGQVAGFTWLYNGKVYGLRLKKTSFTAVTLLYNSTSGMFSSVSSTVDPTNGINLILVRTRISDGKKELGTGAWYSSGSVQPFTVLETAGSQYISYSAVGIAREGSRTVATIGKAPDGETWTYHHWTHNGTEWTPYAINLGSNAIKPFHGETENRPTQFAHSSGLKLMKVEPITWAPPGAEKISMDHDGYSFSIVARPLSDTLEYYVDVNPQELDSVFIDTLGVWNIAIDQGSEAAELVDDLKHFGRVISSGGLILFTPNTSRYDFWAVDPTGNKMRFGKEGTERNSKLAEFTHDVRIHPNPFNPSTTIRVTLASPQRLSVRVFNVLGQMVADLAGGNYDTGEYNFTFNGMNLSSGTYFYRIEIGEEIKTGKLQLLK